MKPKVVFFGNADIGKSTMIGFLFAYANGINMEQAESRIKKRFGSNFRSDYIYSSLINPDVYGSYTDQTTEFVKLDGDTKYEEGEKIIKDTDSETVIQTVTIANDTAKIITRRHKTGVLQRVNSTQHHIKNFDLPYKGRDIQFVLVDTPGHTQFLNERELGISLSDIGIFCIAMNEILSDSFDEMLFSFQDLWEQYNYDKKLIYCLTKSDLVNYSEESYKLACERIKSLCKRVSQPVVEPVFGMEYEFDIEEDNAAAIIPVSVDFDRHETVNIIDHSDKCPWYKGPTLLDAISEQMDEISSFCDEHVADNLLFSIDKVIDNTKTRAGKVFRISIKNGALSVGDRVVLTSMTVDNMQEPCDIEGDVKSIHSEVDPVEGIKEISSARNGDIVTIDLKNCSVGNKRLAKKDIGGFSKYTVGFAAGEAYEKVTRFGINVRINRQILDHVKPSQNIVVLWFGKRVSAKVRKIESYIIYVETMYGIRLDIPSDPKFRRVEEFRNIVFYSESQGKRWYSSGSVCEIEES